MAEKNTHSDIVRALHAANGHTELHFIGALQPMAALHLTTNKKNSNDDQEKNSIHRTGDCPVARARALKAHQKQQC